MKTPSLLLIKIIQKDPTLTQNIAPIRKHYQTKIPNEQNTKEKRALHKAVEQNHNKRNNIILVVWIEK